MGTRALRFAPMSASVPRPQDVASPDAIIRRAYELLSGRAPGPWSAFHASQSRTSVARLIPLERSAEGKLAARVLAPDEFIASRSPFLAQQDFYEWETARREDRFGAFAHVWSNYDAAVAMRGTPIIRRGVNSIQLWNDGARWWILSVLWDAVAALT